MGIETNNKNGSNNIQDKENWTYNPFDVNDLSPLDTLLRRGVVPLSVRLFRPQKYEEAVQNYMKKDGCDRATAQRSMDAYFNDPNGFIVSKQREGDGRKTRRYKPSNRGSEASGIFSIMGN